MKFGRIVTFLLSFLLLLVLTSCEFVRFTYFDTPDEALNERREELFASLEESFQADYYEGEEKIFFEILLQDAINELSECLDREELEKIYLTHLEKLSAVPRSLDAMKEAIREEIAYYASPSDSREKEKKELSALVASYQAQISSCRDENEAEMIFRSFKIDVYRIKTDLAYYEEEVAALKADYRDRLSRHANYADYRPSEQDDLNRAFSDFDNAIAKVTDKNELLAIFENTEAILAAIPTEDALYQKELTALCEDLLDRAERELSRYALESAYDEAALRELLFSHTTKEGASKAAAEYLISAAKMTPKALPLVKEMAKAVLENAYIAADYRESDREAMAALVKEASQKISSEVAPALIDGVIAETIEALSFFSTNDALWQREDEAFLPELSSRYNGKILTPPASLIEAMDLKELAAIIDYYAFYQLDDARFQRDTFRVKIGFSHKDAQWVINEVYWYCELIRSAVGITGYFEEDGDHLVITLVPYAMASVTNVKDRKPLNRNESLVQLYPDKTHEKRAEDFHDFAYLKNEKTLDGIWNTQQLWYALEQGYLPICVEGSIAERSLRRAEEICREVVSDTMTIEEKAFAIFSWFSRNVTYDLQYLPYLYPDDREHFPDSLAATLASFHAEGALFDNYAVCCAFAKAYLIMLRIEGIEAYRLLLHRYTDNCIDNHGENGYGSHSIVTFRGSDGLFYFSDTEQCYVYNNNKCPKFHQFMTIEDHRTPYETGFLLYYDDLPYANKMPEAMLQGLTYQGKPIHVTSREELSEMLDAFAAEPGRVCLSLFSSSRTPFSLEDVIKEDERFKYNTYCYNGFNEYILYVR